MGHLICHWLYTEWLLFFRWCSRSYYAEDGEIPDNGSNGLESVQETGVIDTSDSTSTSDDPFQKSKAPTARFVDNNNKNAREKFIT